MTTALSRPGGVVFRAKDSLYFLSASVATKLLPTPEVARVPGAPPDLVGVALVEGELIPVVSVSGAHSSPVGARPGGPLRGAMLLCTYLGERLGLVGIEVLATGRFDVADDEIVWGGTVARVFDIGAVVGVVRQGRWAV